jgi:uncharacterized membrane protein
VVCGSLDETRLLNDLVVQKKMTETHRRTLARTATYRLMALLITALWTGLSTAILIHVVLTAVHYAHERLWLIVKWGKIGE